MATRKSSAYRDRPAEPTVDFVRQTPRSPMWIRALTVAIGVAMLFGGAALLRMGPFELDLRCRSAGSGATCEVRKGLANSVSIPIAHSSISVERFGARDALLVLTVGARRFASPRIQYDDAKVAYDRLDALVTAKSAEPLRITFERTAESWFGVTMFCFFGVLWVGVGLRRRR